MVSLEDVVAEAAKNGRVCPQPIKWKTLYDLLPDKKRAGAGWSPSLPLILDAWWHTDDVAKRARFREHIEWANAHGCLGLIRSYLGSLTESEWHHVDE